jgi:hypothetical protein
MPEDTVTFHEFLGRFNEAAFHFFNLADAQEKERLRTELIKVLRDYTRQANTSRKGCPPGWTMCSDKSCVPPGVACD